LGKKVQYTNTIPPIRSVTRGRSPLLEKFSPLLEKCVGYSLKVFDIVQKFGAPLRKLFPLLVSQAGYRPGTDNAATEEFVLNVDIFCRYY